MNVHNLLIMICMAKTCCFFFNSDLLSSTCVNPSGWTLSSVPCSTKVFESPACLGSMLDLKNHPEFMFQHMSYFIIIFMSPPSSAKSLDDGLCFRSLVCILLDCVENSTILSGGCQSSDGLLQQMEWMSLSSNVCGMLWTSVDFCGSVCWPRLSQKPSDSDLDGFCCWVAEEEVIMKTHKA